MRKLKVFSVLLLLISSVAFAGYKIYENGLADNEAPVITCSEDNIQVSVADTEEKLLEGVTAEDQRDGDITDKIVVQSIAEFSEDNKREITYAVADEAGNVGYGKRTLEYTDYSEPRFNLEQPLLYPLGSTFNVADGVSASGALDGDLTSKIKYTLDKSISTTTAGSYNVEFRVSDSAGRTSYLQTVLEVYDPSDYRIEVNLSQYLVYIGVNEGFDPNAYYVGTDIETDTEEVILSINSTVNTAQPGCYYVDYNVTTERSAGKSRLVVVVV